MTETGQRLFDKLQLGYARLTAMPSERRQQIPWKHISVIIASRLLAAPDGQQWLAHAIASVRAQTIAPTNHIHIIVGLDHGVSPPTELQAKDITYVHAAADAPRGQASALNAAMEAAFADPDCEVLAFLEDDDLWHPRRLELGLPYLHDFAVISASQQEEHYDGGLALVNDFATPSGWLCLKSTAAKIGLIDTSFQYHIDNYWLGRANQLGLLRLHQVEQTAPQDLREIIQRPNLLLYVNIMPDGSAIGHLPIDENLVRRVLHPMSRTSETLVDAEVQAISKQLFEQINATFGGQQF